MIVLLEEEREFLKPILTKYVLNKWGKYWWAQKLLDKIYGEEERIEETKNCKHEYGTYKGKKECCVKCGSYDVGMGEEWTLSTKIKP